MGGSTKTLKHFLRGFEEEIHFGAVMVDTLERDGFELTHVRRAAPRSWLLRAKPPQHIQEGFGLAPELLFIAAQGEVQSRDLQRAADEVVRSDLRLDGNLVIVTDDGHTHDDGRPLKDRLDRMPGRDQRVAWVCGEDRSWPPLSEVLRLQLPTYDVFEERDPVRGYQLMGRDAEVMELRTRVTRGDAVGVFGLRKCGKTSLVRAVTDWLDPASGIKTPGAENMASQACVIWLDAQGLDGADVDDVADELLAALRRRMRAAGRADVPPAQQGIAGLKSASQAIVDEGMRLCFVIDEYDFLFEREGSLGPVPGISRLLGLVRALSQQHQGAVSLVLIGRDPEHLSVPHLDGVPNPLLAGLTPMWLGPIRPPHDTEMLRKLGRRVGLAVGPETATLARAWTGGHPLLHRQFGSALREEVRLHAPGVLLKEPTDPHRERAVERFLGRQAVLDVDREIIALLSKRYSAAYALLLDLIESHDPAAAVKRSGGSQSSGMRVLRNFGLLDEATLALPKHLSWYVRTLLPTQARVAV
ncbi:AAA family ATPase [Sorangium sp. So ce1036]|uniref:AAA family ATPase n=1 Tax=Sorangium sp. So ce1036 TaxID=3133328 RepID=UPI003F0B00FF